MKPGKTRKLVNAGTRTKMDLRANRKRRSVQTNPSEAQAFLVRLVGEDEAKNLSSEIVLHHRRD